MLLLMMKHSGIHRLLLLLFCLPYAYNYKMLCVPWATYCSFSSSLLWPMSDVSADMFIVRAVRGPSIHSTLCSSCLCPCYVEVSFESTLGEDYNYPDWVLAELDALTFHSINTAAGKGQVWRRKR